MCVKDHGWISLAVGRFYSTWSPSYSLNPSSLSRQALVTGRALKAMTLFSLSISAVRTLVFNVPFIDPSAFCKYPTHGSLKRKHLCHDLYPIVLNSLCSETDLTRSFRSMEITQRWRTDRQGLLKQKQTLFQEKSFKN